MQVLILATILSYPVPPLCRQWLNRVDQESRHAARLVWSPQKERHIRRMNQASNEARKHCKAEIITDKVAAVTTAKGR